jgi:hypothetical protein
MHYHIMTQYGEDVACSDHTLQALVANTDEEAVAHSEDDQCGRCFVCEGYKPGTCTPINSTTN